MKPFLIIPFIKQLIAYSPRQGANETRAARFLIHTFDQYGITYKLQRFTTTIPSIKQARLFADGVSIPCKGTSFVSGTISNKNHLISSLTSSQPLFSNPNINFNPQCDDLSQANFYNAPSIAIAKQDVKLILDAKNVQGTVTVSQQRFRSTNILVGNHINPSTILFAHYDSIGPGATDNASGVAVCAKLAIDYPQTLAKTLYVFAGNEELSSDRMVYWGHGFRVFEKRYGRLLNAAKQIIVVDCVGNGLTNITQNPKITGLAFPIKNVKRLQSKIYNVCGNIDQLMTVYHSDRDTVDQLSQYHLEEAVRVIHSHFTL